MIENTWQADIRVGFSINRILLEDSSGDRVNQDWRSLVKLQLAINSGFCDSIGSINIQVHHARHVYMKFLCQEVLEVGKELYISDLRWFDSWHLNAEAHLFQLAGFLIGVLLD